MLVVGFYLVNLGFVSLYLKLDQEVLQITGIFEALSAKLGVVMLVLGGMHFFNIWLFARMGKKEDRCHPPTNKDLYQSFPAKPPLPRS